MRSTSPLSIIGPTSVSGSIGSPTFRPDTLAVRPDANSSKRDWCT